MTLSTRRLAGVAVTVLTVVGGAGCSVLLGPPGAVRPESEFAAIQPGMTSQDVLSRIGRPTWSFGVRQESLTIWNYRFNPFECLVYQVSMRPDGTVRDTGTSPDPACDGPSRRR